MPLMLLLLCVYAVSAIAMPCQHDDAVTPPPRRRRRRQIFRLRAMLAIRHFLFSMPLRH